MGSPSAFTMMDFDQLEPRWRWTLAFENAESFKLWLATDSSQMQRLRIPAVTSCNAKPSCGTITNLRILQPRVFRINDICSVRWVHWGDGGVRLRTMSDSNPTMNQGADQALAKESSKQSRIRKDYLQQRLQVVLALRCFLKSGLVTESGLIYCCVS